MIVRGAGVIWIGVLFTLGTLSIGCGQKATSGPPEVHYGEDVCTACGMIISDERFTGAIVTRDEQGERQSFLYDDIGGMATDASSRLTGVDDELYVHDSTSGEWIDATAGFFVRSKALSTPMAWGVAAFHLRADAQAMVDRIGGELLTWDELQSSHAEPTKRAEPVGSD